MTSLKYHDLCKYFKRQQLLFHTLFNRPIFSNASFVKCLLREPRNSLIGVDNNTIISVINQTLSTRANCSKNCEIITNDGSRLCLHRQNVEADRRESRRSFETDIVSSNSSVSHTTTRTCPLVLEVR